MVAIVKGLGHKPGDFFGHMNALNKPCGQANGSDLGSCPDFTQGQTMAQNCKPSQPFPL